MLYATIKRLVNIWEACINKHVLGGKQQAVFQNRDIFYMIRHDHQFKSLGA